MEFELEDGQVFVTPNRATLDHWLRRLAPGSGNTFAILTMANGDYIQTACDDKRFIIECRRQDPLHHYSGINADGSTTFDIAAVVEAFVAFGWSHPDTPAFLNWQNIDAQVGL